MAELPETTVVDAVAEPAGVVWLGVTSVWREVDGRTEELGAVVVAITGTTVFEDSAAAALDALWIDERADTMTDCAFCDADDATGTTTLTPVVEREAEGCADRTEFALLSMDES